MLSDVLDLFVSFARVTLFGFGGGPSMIPLVRAEVVEGRGWLTPEVFLDAFAFGSALPGPIVTKLAFFIGHHVAGWPGAAAALLGASLPTLLLMLVVIGLLTRAKDNEALTAAIGGIRPIVVALLLLVAWDFAPAALGAGAGAEGPAFLPLRWLVAVVSLVATLKFKLHPVVLIVLGAAVGMLFSMGS